MTPQIFILRIFGRSLCLCLGVAAVSLCASASAERIYELVIEGKRAGYSRYSAHATPEGLETRGETVIKVSLLGAPFDMTYRSVMRHAPKTGALISYRLDFSRGSETASCVAKPVGSELQLTTTVGGKTSTHRLPWGPGVYLVEGNALDTWAQMLAHMRGNVPTSVNMISPLAGVVQKVRISRPGIVTVDVKGSKRRCDCLRIGEGPESLDLIVTRDTREIIEMRVPAQKAAFRKSTAAALRGLVSYDPGSRLFSIVEEELPDPAKLTLMKCRVKAGVAGEKPTEASLRSAVQKFSGTARGGTIDGVFEVVPYAYDGKAAPRISDMPPSDQGLAKYLKAEPNIECDDPEIKELARKLTEGCATAWDAVVKIGAWIKANITYGITGSGARECLRSRKGDCGPHAWLTIALCRAAGIPARITGGVLYSRALGGSFGQHYWTRVWMGPDGWVPIDTTTGEVGTLSPAHITLWNLAGIASLDVKVLDFAPRVAAANASSAQPRREYRPTVGQTETWAFVQGGKEIATQKAICTALGEEAGRVFSEWRFEFEMPSASVAIAGMMSLWSDAAPRKLTFEAKTSGGAQSGTCTFGSDAVDVDLKVGEMPVKRRHSLQRGEMMQMNNLLTAFSLGMRSLALKPGETRNARFFAVASLQSIDMTFSVAGEPRRITVMGQPRWCLACEVEPIKNRFFTDAETGELLKVEAIDGRLAIERR